MLININLTQFQRLKIRFKKNLIQLKWSQLTINDLFIKKAKIVNVNWYQLNTIGKNLNEKNTHFND